MKGLLDINYTQISMKHEALEQYIEKQDNQFQNRVLEYAKTMAEEGRPKIRESLKRYKFTIESWYSSLWQHSKKELQSQEFEQLNKHDTQYVEKKIKENKDKIGKNVHERQSHIIENNRIVNTYDESKYPIVLGSLIFIGLFVGVVYGRSLMIGLRENFIISMMWGFLIGGSISMLAKTLPRATSEWCKTIWQKRVAIIGSIILVASICYLIGTFRVGNTGALALSEAANHTTNASPLSFMLFNTFVFFVEILMCFFLLPTHEQSLKILAKKRTKPNHIEFVFRNGERVARYIYN